MISPYNCNLNVRYGCKNRDPCKTLKYFEGLTKAELESLQKYFIEKPVAKGEIFLIEGEFSEYLYFLIEGMVKIYKSLSNGKEQILHIAPPGEALNDTSAYDGGSNIGSHAGSDSRPSLRIT